MGVDITSTTENALSKFYQQQGIRPGAFCCKYKSQCLGSAGRPLVHGAEAHVGTNYGDPFRLVVVSLDAAGDSRRMHERRALIEGIKEPQNQHMRGTLSTLRAFYPQESSTAKLFSRYAMINAAKCSGNDGYSKAVPEALYSKCRSYAQHELLLLDPDIVVAQGAQARAVSPHKVAISPEESEAALQSFASSDVRLLAWAKSMLREYVFRWHLSKDKFCWAIEAPHPSARGGQWHRFERTALHLVTVAIVELFNATR